MAYYEMYFPTSNSKITGKMCISSYSNGSSANTSNVSVSVYFSRGSGDNTNSYGHTNTGVQCDSQSQWENDYLVYVGKNGDYGRGISFAKWFYNIPHNNDGTKSCYFRVCGNSGCSIGNFDSSWWLNLDTIPRYTSITRFDVSDVEQTSAKVTWSTADTVDWVRCYLNGSSQHTDNPGGVNGASGTFIYTGMNQGNAGVPTLENSTLEPGTTYNLRLQVKRKDSQLWTLSDLTRQFTTKSIASISNENIDYNIGDTLPLTFENYENNKSYLAMDIITPKGEWEENIIRTDEVLQVENYNWDLSAYQSLLYEKLFTRNSAQYRIRCGTTINGKEYEKTITGTIYVTNSNPIFRDYEYGDELKSTQDIIQNPQYMFENFGNMKAKISVSNRAIALNGASIIKYNAAIIDKSTGVQKLYSEIAYSDNADVVFSFGNLIKSGTYQINIYAIDSRDNISQTISKTFYVLPYSQPQVTIELSRLNNYEQETELSISAIYSALNISSVAKNNSFTIQYAYAEDGQPFGNYHDLSLTISNYDSDNKKASYHASPFIDLNDNSNKSFNFKFLIKDRVSTLTIDKLINKGVPIMFMGTTDEHNYVSVNRLPDIDSDCVFQVENDMLIDDMKVKDRIVNHELFSETEPDSSMQEIGDRWWKEEAIDNVYAGITGDGEIVYPDGSLVPIKGIVQNVSDLDNIDEYGYLVDAMLAKELKNDVNTLQKTVTNLNNQVENDTKFIPFTITPTVSNSSSYQIASVSKMKQIFGNDAGVVNSGAIIMNGDGNASPVHFEGATWQGDKLYCVFAGTVNTGIRITGLLYYAPSSTVITTI